MGGVIGSSEDRYDFWGFVWFKIGVDIIEVENRVFRVILEGFD